MLRLAEKWIRASRCARTAWLAEAASALYIGAIALIAQSTGIFYVLFL